MADIRFLPPPIKTNMFNRETGLMEKPWADFFNRFNRYLGELDFENINSDTSTIVGGYFSALEALAKEVGAMVQTPVPVHHKIEAIEKDSLGAISLLHRIEALEKDFRGDASFLHRVEALETLLAVGANDGHKHVNYLGEAYQNILTPVSVNVVAGGAPVGTVANVQTWNDGNVYQVPEVAATPGFDIQFTITGVRKIARVSSNIYYAGTSTHQVELQIYNNNTTTWDTIVQVSSSLGYNTRYVNFPLPSDKDYINASMQSLVRVYHVNGGNASHDIYIDFIAILN